MRANKKRILTFGAGGFHTEAKSVKDWAKAWQKEGTT
jgi:hypothetical protein